LSQAGKNGIGAAKSKLSVEDGDLCARKKTASGEGSFVNCPDWWQGETKLPCSMKGFNFFQQ
jgi:hypothetical protein